MTTETHVRVLRAVERAVIARALHHLAETRLLLSNHREMARELATAIEDAGSVVLSDSEGPI